MCRSDGCTLGIDDVDLRRFRIHPGNLDPKEPFDVAKPATQVVCFGRHVDQSGIDRLRCVGRGWDGAERPEGRKERQGRQNRSRMAQASDAGAVPSDAQKRNRARLQRCLLAHEGRWSLSMRLLWGTAVRFENEIRFWDRLAELLAAKRKTGDSRTRRSSPCGISHRGPLPPLRCAPGTCFPRRAGADRPALLHEFGGAQTSPSNGHRDGEFFKYRPTDPKMTGSRDT